MSNPTMATKMIKDFTDKEFIEEMKRRFIVPQWYTREQIFENIKNYNEELNDKSIDNIIDNVKRNMYQCVDELVESYVDNYKEEEEEQDERYCDNDDCPYGGFCCFEVLEEHKGKPYICEGCSTGIGLQEQEEKEKQLNAVKTIIKYVYRYVFGYHEEADGYGRCDCGGGYNTQSCFWHYEEDVYACLKCRDLAEEGNRHDICTDCYNRECECESEEEEEE